RVREKFGEEVVQPMQTAGEPSPQEAQPGRSARIGREEVGREPEQRRGPAGAGGAGARRARERLFADEVAGRGLAHGLVADGTGPDELARGLDDQGDLTGAPA